MLYLDHELLTQDRIIQYLASHLIALKAPKIPLTRTPSALEKFQKRLRSIFFVSGLSNEDACRALEMEPRFHYYPKLRKTIHALLSLADATELEVLYNTLCAISEVDWVCNPHQFHEYNSRYGYFDKPTPELLALFNELALSCRSQIFLFEMNNTDNEYLAYDYAYKLMVLFVDPDVPLIKQYSKIYTGIHQLMKSVMGDIAHPLHEILVVKLNALPHASHLYDRAGWRKLIKKEKARALSFWVQAQKIEEQLEKQGIKRAPLNLREACEMLARCEYHEAHLDPEFAALCYRYKVPSDIFNRCREYIASGWPKKETDKIPNLLIKGQGDAENFIWVKLPLQDKRSLILGYITDCCQSIGGHSEVCVKDALTLRHNAIYVLLKQKRKGQKPVLIDDAINDKDFKIVGQAYLWISLLGNVCLDSIECLKEDVSLQALQSILSDFATALFEKDPIINYVTLGQGGKTPKAIFKVASISEIMREGRPYGDGAEQYCIAQKNLPLIIKQNRLKAYFHTASVYALDYLLTYAIPETNGFFEQLLKVIHDLDTKWGHDLLRHHAKLDDLIVGLIHLFKWGRLNFSNVKMLIQHAKPREITSVIQYVATTDLFGEDRGQVNFELILCHHDIRRIMMAFQHFYLESLVGELLTQENFDAIISHHEPQCLAFALSILHRADLLSEEIGFQNRQLIIHHRELRDLVSALQEMNLSALLNQEYGQINFDAIVKHRNPRNVVYAIQELSSVGLLNEVSRQTNFEALINHRDPHSLSYALQSLHFSGLLNGDRAAVNREIVCSHWNLSTLTDALQSLRFLNNLGTDTSQENFEMVIHHQDISGITVGLNVIYFTGLFNSSVAHKNFQRLMQHGDSRDLSSILHLLNSKGLLSTDCAQANFDAVTRHERLGKLRAQIESLATSGHLTQTTFEKLTLAQFNDAQTLISFFKSPKEGARAVDSQGLNLST